MALSKIGTEAVEHISSSANATFLTVDASEQITVASEGGAVTTSVQQGLTKVWVNFNGTGTIATRDSLNVTSLTDNGVGNYECHFVNDMANANYSCSANNDNADTIGNPTAFNVGYVTVKTYYPGGSAYYDVPSVLASIHGDLA